MADIIDYKIYGDDFQAVEVELDPRETVLAEVGAMLCMEEGIQMYTSTNGGILKGLTRMFTGESFFITNFVNEGMTKSRVIFSAPYPGKIIPIDLAQTGNEFYCQKDAFLCAAKGVEVKVAFTKKIGAGIFGGEGFILQRLMGDGLAFIHAGGSIIEKNLMPGETLRVDTGCLVAFSSSIQYDIKFVGGFKNALFGGEGLFLATVTGPGKVYLQSLPFSRIADRIISASSYGNKGETRRGGLLSDILMGD
jgi:uncharacterized protein (TIGR00266 family)